MIVLLIGVGIGSAANAKSGQIASQQAQIHRLEASLAKAKGQASFATGQMNTARQQMATAQQAAAHATSAADAKARARHVSRMSAVTALQRKLNREQGVVVASTISADGVYVVGKDIPAGTYHTTGDGGSGYQCYYATLGSTDTNNILDNNNFDGPETVDLSGAYAFQISGGCTWHKV